jgi:hypothetical protein
MLQAVTASMTRQMTGHHVHPMLIVVSTVAVMYRVCIASILLSLYLVPMPGVSFSFHQMFPVLGQTLKSAINTDLLREVLGDFNDVIHFLPPVGMFSVMPAAVTVIILVLIALGEIAMTIITAGSYCILGVLSIVGPLMIPFFVLPGHDKRFWSWFDNMLVYSMYGFIGTAFIYAFCAPYLTFFSDLTSYSVASWLVSIPYLILITIAFLWTMFQVPAIAHLVFGGVGGIASSFATALQGLVVLGISKAVR